MKFKAKRLPARTLRLIADSLPDPVFPELDEVIGSQVGTWGGAFEDCQARCLDSDVDEIMVREFLQSVELA